jgi:hypothetical protein
VGASTVSERRRINITAANRLAGTHIHSSSLSSTAYPRPLKKRWMEIGDTRTLCGPRGVSERPSSFKFRRCSHLGMAGSSALQISSPMPTRRLHWVDSEAGFLLSNRSIYTRWASNALSKFSVCRTRKPGSLPLFLQNRTYAV